MILRSGSPREAGINPAKLKVAEEMVQDYVQSGETHGFVLLATRKGIVFENKAFGTLSHEEDSPPLKSDTIFPMSSITKPVTATAAMMLFEEGKLDINRPISYYVPEFSGDGKELALVHQLMTHTTGMNDEVIWEWQEKNKDKNPILPECPKDQNPLIHGYVFSGISAPLWKKPGEEMSYCNWGMELMAEIIRRAGGRSYESIVRERIFEPLDMKDSYLIVPEKIRDRIIRRPSHLDDGWYLRPERLETPWAAAGLYSTAWDMAVFCQMFINKGTYNNTRLLSPDSVEEMTRNQIPGLSSRFFNEFFEEAGWGYCWDMVYGKNTIGKLMSTGAFSHGGASGVMIFVDPHYELFWAMLFVDYSTEKAPFTFPGEVSDMIIRAIES